MAGDSGDHQEATPRIGTRSLGEPDEGIPIPTYKDVMGLSKTTAEMFAKFALATAVVTLSLESQLPVHKKSAETFWGVWK